jgi:hypothetical protein
MTIAGVGAGISELTALAATSELAPTAKRGKYVAVLVFTIIPFCPSVLWGQLIASHAGWRWCGLLCGVWVSIGFFLVLIFYFPPPRVNSLGFTRKEIIAQIDFVGGFLSISGMVLFMAGMQWGGYQVQALNRLSLLPLTLPSIHGKELTYSSHSFSGLFSSSLSASGRSTEPSIQCSLLA